MEALLPFGKIIIGFIICTAITTAAGYLTFLALLASGEIAFLKAADARAIPFLLLFGAVFLGVYPAGALLLREDLRAITPAWLFADALVVLFGCSIVFWAASIAGYGKIARNWRKWFPRNGEKKTFHRGGGLWKIEHWKDNLLDGDVRYYCPDGRVYFSATFEMGKKVGRVYSTRCEKFDADKTESFYDPSGNLWAEKKFVDRRLVEEYSASEGTKKFFHYSKEGVLVTEYISFYKKEFRGSEKMTKNIERKYDPSTGSIIEEFVNEYPGQKVNSRRRIFDPQTGELISEKVY